MIIISALSLIGMAVVYVLNVSHDISSAVVTTSFALGSGCIIWILFASKFQSLFSIVPKRRVSAMYEAEQPTAPTHSLEFIRALPIEKQYEYYTEQIVRYTNLRMNLAELDASSREGRESSVHSHNSRSLKHVAEERVEGCPDPDDPEA